MNEKYEWDRITKLVQLVLWLSGSSEEQLAPERHDDHDVDRTVDDHGLHQAARLEAHPVIQRRARHRAHVGAGVGGQQPQARHLGLELLL